MKQERVGSVLMVGLVLALLMGQPRAQFFECYTKCFLFCIIIPNHTTSSCSLQCLRDCILPPPGNNTSSANLFCNLGCATSLCTNLSTKQNPGAKQVVKCVGSCSDTCTKNYTP